MRLGLCDIPLSKSASLSLETLDKPHVLDPVAGRRAFVFKACVKHVCAGRGINNSPFFYKFRFALSRKRNEDVVSNAEVWFHNFDSTRHQSFTAAV